MSMLIKLLIILSIITISLAKICRHGVNCYERSTEKCEQYFGCHLAWMSFELKCIEREGNYAYCCSEDKEGKACAKVDTNGTPICIEAEPDNFCHEPEITFLE
jgi:hypothetical protein